MKKIKKYLYSFLIFSFLASASSAFCDKHCKELYKSPCPKNEEQKQIQDDAKNSTYQKACEKCTVEDDEYCIYNQCYFDKQYRILKTNLNPKENQENCLDNIYLNFKQDLEIQCDKYIKAKNKLLELISLDYKCLKEQKHQIKDIQKDIKEKYKDYISDTKEILCKNQKRTFRKFQRKQNRKIKQIKKYGAIYKFPCP